MASLSLRTWCVLLSIACIAAACGDERPAIAVIPKGTQHAFWRSVHAGALAAATELGYEVRWKGPDPEGDRQAQIHLLHNLVLGGVKGVVLAPIDEQALARPVADVVQSGVPVVVIDSHLEGEAHAAYVATDNDRGGEMAGQHLGALLGGKGKVLVLRFQQGSASTTQREAGALRALAAFPGITVASSDQYANDEQKARATAASLLLAHPDANGVFCPNESTTHGFLVALQQAGLAGKVSFVGFDSSEPLVRGLEQGQIHGLVVQDPVAMGRQGVLALHAFLTSQPVQKVQNTALQLVTPTNRDEPAVRALLSPDLSILQR